VRWPSVLVLFLLLTAVYTYPLGIHPGTQSLDLGPDTRLFLWTLGWDVHAFSHDPLSIFDANIFHPERRTLAYSEHQIGSALLAAPLLWTTGSLLFAMNGVLLLSSVLSGVFSYSLARQIGLSRAGAVMVGVVFLLTPPRFFRLGQLHLATVQWIPLCLALLHRYANRGSRRHLIGAALAFFLQALAGGQSALFLALAASGLLVYLFVFGALRPESSIYRDGLLAAALLLAINLPFAAPYLRVQRELGLERSLGEAVEWSPNAPSFLASPTHVHRFLARCFGVETRLAREARAYLFPGIAPLVLACLALLFPRARAQPRLDERPEARAQATLWIVDGAIAALVIAALVIEVAGGVRWSLPGFRVSAASGGRALAAALAIAAFRWIRFRRTPFAFRSPLLDLRERTRSFLEPRSGIEGGYYAFLAVFSLWASLGPGAGLYTALYRLVPGFDFVRVPSRITILTVLALAVLAGIGFDRLRSRLAALGFLGFALLELAAFPLGTRAYPVSSSPMDRFLAASERAPIAVFPVPDPRDAVSAASRHSLYMLNSTSHYFPMVNGYSGFTPPSHDRLFRGLVSFPDERGLEALESLSVRWVVFHRGGYDDEAWNSLLARLSRFPDRLELRAEYDEGRVYELSGLSGRDRPDRGSSGASRSRSSSVPPGSGR
jgi:hypothetical protein